MVKEMTPALEAASEQAAFDTRHDGYLIIFALEGALAAVEGDLDLFGLLVLSFATALGGGIIRDLLIGAIPPGSIRDWRLGSVAFLGGAIVFLFHHFVQQIPNPLILSLDAAGLALFAVSGAGKALAYGVHPFIAILMGGITGVGGGTVRDVLLAQVPTVLRADVYADRRPGGRGCHGACGSHESSQNFGGSAGSNCLFHAADHQRVAALESASCARSMKRGFHRNHKCEPI